MREIKTEVITNKIEELFIDACINIPCNVLNSLENAKEKEESPLLNL